MNTQTKPGFLEKTFQLKAHNTSVKTEVMAGFTTFVTMAYILGTIPNLLSGTGVDRGYILSAMVILCFVTSLAMALYTNLPFAMAPGLSSCAIVASMVADDGISAPVAAGIVFWTGILFVVISVFGLRDVIVKAIPTNLKYAISAGVGMTIASLGMRNGGLVLAKANNSLGFNDLTTPTAILAITGVVLILVTKTLKVPGYMIVSILITTCIGIPMGLTTLPETFVSLPSNPFGNFLEIDLMGSLQFAFFPFVLTLFMQDFFSTLGTALGMGAKAGYLDENGDLPGIGRVFKVDSSATVLGSLFCIPCMTTYLESSAGVEAGGKTGLTALSSNVFLLCSLLITPVVLMIPTAATAPALIIIGVDMLKSMGKLDYSEFTEYFPGFVCLAITIFAGGIANGICVAIPVYLILKLSSGKIKEVPPSMLIMTALSILYFYNA